MTDTNSFDLSEEDETAFSAMQGGAETEEVAEEGTEVATEATEEAEKAAVETDKTKQRAKTVPHQAFHEERERRKAAEAQARQYAEDRARLDERLRMFSERVEQVEAPDPDQDPIAALRYEREQREALQRQWDDQQKQAQQATQQQQYEQQVIGYASQQIAEYKADTPDYDEALNFLETNRVEELKLFGLSEHQAMAQIRSEALSLAAHCAQRGANAADTLYRMAQIKGFKSKPQTLEAEQKIDTVSQGQERGKSLSSAGGKSGGTEMTVETLAKMPQDEFDAWCTKNPKKAKALMGG